MNDCILLLLNEDRWGKGCNRPDRKSADEVLDLLGRLAGEHGKTILMVTHDPLAAERARVVLHLEKGVLVDTVTAGRAR